MKNSKYILAGMSAFCLVLITATSIKSSFLMPLRTGVGFVLEMCIRDRREGGIIKEGYHEEADRLRHAKTEGKDWLAQLEQSEREKTGIKNLKVKFNKVFGYYFEVTNSFKDLVPDYFIRKQTLTNAERYTTCLLYTSCGSSTHRRRST